jgi:hypothetical protein
MLLKRLMAECSTVGISITENSLLLILNKRNLAWLNSEKITPHFITYVRNVIRRVCRMQSARDNIKVGRLLD